MSSTDLIEHVIEWDDSSQSQCLDEIPHMDENVDIVHSDDSNIVIEVISPDTAPIENSTSNTEGSTQPEIEVVTFDSVHDETPSELTEESEETPSGSSSPEQPDKAKKSRGKKQSTKAKCVKPKRKPTKKKNTKTSDDDKPKPKELPSVYSRNQIARHAKRINKLKELEQNDESDSEASNEDVDETSDRDIDINLRIFEGSTESVDNVVIGEIQCNILDDNSSTKEANNSNKNASNVFKLSVNTNFVDVCDTNDSLASTVADMHDEEADVDDPLDFSDNDSDLEILVSKPIVRKRATQPVKKEKPTEKKQKLTMYDLIHDKICFSSDSKTDESETEQKDPKTKESKKSKTNNKKSKMKKEEPTEDLKPTTESKEEKNQNLPVPKLKVGADGEVIIDMDSLVIEQTGVSEARNALANSEVVEECALSYTSYNKRNSFRKQWSPHETLKFYKVLSTVGTDFTLMATLFPGRTRKCMKRKFKKEEKTSPELILKALSCKQNFNIDLLEKELQLKDEKVNQFKENSRKQKIAQKKAMKDANKKEKEKEKEKITSKGSKIKRKSFFETSISHFQDR
ncbi:transcription factor TFIIIB component B'' homolog [Planococcus citri]|uniref:transcription factor TFIIIB component B'' homolog n=1 Tax=Planococcus citri TaxID=170843 RepID=UPI0031F8FB92